MDPKTLPKIAVVTGASSGIGREISLLLARRGFRVALLARREEKLAALAAEIGSGSDGEARAAAVPVDLTLPDAAAGAWRAVLAMGEVEVLINNAGFGLNAPFLDQSPGELRRLMEIHYFAAAGAIRAFLPGMLRRQRGRVINVASIATKMGPWGHSGYAAAKSAIVALTQSLAADYAGSGVRFSYVNPGIVETEHFEHLSYAALRAHIRGRFIPAAEAARRIVSLIDRPRLELCVPRHYRVMDAIRALSPSLAHWIVRRESRPR